MLLSTTVAKVGADDLELIPRCHMRHDENCAPESHAPLVVRGCLTAGVAHTRFLHSIEPLCGMTSPKSLLDALQGGDPESPALLCSGSVQLSRKQLKELCIVFAEAIRRAGVKTGDAVSIAETNTLSACHVSCISWSVLSYEIS